MRNTMEYPITKEELIDTLSECCKYFPDDLVGDIRPLILSKLLDKIDQIYDIIDKN